MTLSLARLLAWSDQTNKPTEWSHTLVTFGTLDQSDEETWPDQERSTYLPAYLPALEKAIVGTCDICDTDYNTDNWEPGLMTIFVTWQLVVTLDSIRNSCNVFVINFPTLPTTATRAWSWEPAGMLSECQETSSGSRDKVLLVGPKHNMGPMYQVES